MATVYLITSTNEYNDMDVERIYTQLEAAKNYLLKNYEFWVGSYPDANKNGYKQGVKNIQAITPGDLKDNAFFVVLKNAGITLTLQRWTLDEKVEVI